MVSDRTHEIALATDLYQMTMGASYHALEMDQLATFSLMIRSFSENRSYYVAAGIADAIDRLANLHFDDESLNYLASTGQIREDFVESLHDFRFTGDVWSVDEGEIVFPDEPILEIQAPIIQAQLAETMMINAIHYASLVATKASRCTLAASGATLIDFGLRRTPGIEAGLISARSMYLAGFASTSNLLAGERYGIPVAGTVAHSFIESRPEELEAFRDFRDTFPGPVTLLIDTYDTERGAQHTVTVANDADVDPDRILAVRLDSGDLLELSKKVRGILDDAGLNHVQIVASGGLDEFSLEELTRGGAPIDAYGVGTRIGTSADSPMLDMAYKLVEYDGVGKLKLSTGKTSLVGPKQVWRRFDEDGQLAEDVIATRDEPAPGKDWQALLKPRMTHGQVHEPFELKQGRELHARRMTQLPDLLKVIRGLGAYKVQLSSELVQRQDAAIESVRRREGLDRD